MQTTTGLRSDLPKQMLEAEALVTRHNFTIVFAAQKAGVDKDELRAWIASRSTWRNPGPVALNAAGTRLDEIHKLHHQGDRAPAAKRFVCPSHSAPEQDLASPIQTRTDVASLAELANFQVF